MLVGIFILAVALGSIEGLKAEIQEFLDEKLG